MSFFLCCSWLTWLGILCSAEGSSPPVGLECRSRWRHGRLLGETFSLAHFRRRKHGYVTLPVMALWRLVGRL